MTPVLVASLTRRGRIALGGCVLGALMAVVVGGRSLNAVVVPAAVALIAGYLQVARLEYPDVRRTGLTDGFAGETRTVTIEFFWPDAHTAARSRFVGTVRDDLAAGLTRHDDHDGSTRVAIGDEPARYRVRYTARGEHRVGPLTVTATDVLGLWRRRSRIDDTDSVLVYPSCVPVSERLRRELSGETPDGDHRRGEFDRLREYARGDPLRDVHWPSTAKRDDLVVKTFTADTPDRRVSLVGETRVSPDGAADAATDTPDATAEANADALAAAVASIGLELLADGVGVDVTLPGGAVAVDPGPRGRRALLELAARTGPGSTSDPADADVHLVAAGGEVQVRTATGRRPFSAREAGAVTTGAGDGDRESAASSWPYQNQHQHQNQNQHQHPHPPAEVSTR